MGTGGLKDVCWYPMELAIVKLIKKSLKDRMMDFTTRSRLEDHNMSVSRFIELYGNTIA